MYFALRLFYRSGSRPAVDSARSAYAAAGGKFALTALGFAALFAGLRPIAPLAVFAGYCVMWLVHTVILAWLLRRPA